MPRAGAAPGEIGNLRRRRSTLFYLITAYGEANDATCRRATGCWARR